MTKTAKVLCGLILAVFLFVPLFPARAATITPPRLELSGDPGQAIKGEIKLYNDKTTPQTFYFVVLDFEARDETGNPQFVSTSDGLDSWIKVQPSQVLGPKQEKTIPFSLTIPQNIDPGGYFAGIFATTNPPQPQGGQVTLSSQIGSLVFLRVNGNVPQSTSILEFATIDHHRIYVSLPI